MESKFEAAFQCEICKKKYRGKRGLARRKARGCFGTGGKRVFPIEDVRYYLCIGNYRDLSVDYLLSLYWRYDKGWLPFPGLLGDQPNKIIEIFDIIESVRNRKNKEAEAKASKGK